MIQYLVYIPVVLGVGALSLIVFIKNPKNPVNRIYFIFSIIVFLWIAFLFIADTSKIVGLSTFFVRSAVVLSSLLPLFFLWFSYIFPNYRPVRTLYLILFSIIPIIFVLTAFSGMQVIDVDLKPWGAEVVRSGPLYLIQPVYILFYFGLSTYLLYKKSRHSKGQQRSQINLIIFGTLFALIVNIITNNILVALGSSKYWVLVGTASFLVFVGCIAYAIIRHKLFDIRAVVARAVTYLGAIVTLAAVYGFVIFRVITLFTENLSQNTQYAIYTILAVILAFTFQPLKRFFEKITDKIFFRDKYDPQTVINSIGRILASEIQLERLVDKVTSELMAEMRIASVDIVVVGEKSIFYQNTTKSSRRSYEMRDLKKLGKSIIVADDLASGERKEIMTKYSISVSLALRTSEAFIGYLLLGEKLSGDIYNDTDLRVLRIVGNELAIAIQNAKSFAEIQQFNETLQTKIAWATQKLRHANTDLKKLDEAKDEFISMASHQLRTPLTTTKGYVSMVLEEDFGKISKAQIEPLQQALDSANRMGGLVNDLLNVSRMDAGKFFIDAHEIDLAKVVQSEVDGLQTMAASKNVKLAYQPPAKTLPPINLDEEKTRQVVMNLVDNAIHYSSPTKTDSAVKVSLQQDGQDVVFKVVDNGIGVPEQMKQKLFTKFYRASNAQAARPDGTGLGLYLVKRVVEDQGGQLIFESKEGEGSTFGFRFPLKTKFKAGVTKARVELSSSN